MGEASKELLEKIPAEKCWEMSAQTLTRFHVLRGVKTMPAIMGKEEGIFAPVWGWERWKEIATKIIVDGAKRFFPRVKEMFNISVKDADGAARLFKVASTLMFGPKCEIEIVESTPERAIIRWTKCPWWERYNEFNVDSEFRISCYGGHQAVGKEGLKVINPKITFKQSKSLAREDLYCEDIIEFEEEIL
jgi:hypothetical protein